MDRRPLTLLLALALLGTVPTVSAAASVDALLAGAPSGTLSDGPSDALLQAQADGGTLSDAPTKATGDTSDSGDSSAAPTASALPFTGSDPRVTLLLGAAALLAGAGLRLRTGDARDF